MAIQVFNILDFVVVIPLGPILMRSLDINATEFGFLAASYKVSSGFISLFYTTVADHFNRKSLTLFSLFFFILATLFCAIAPSYEVLLLARIFAGVFGGMLTPSVYAIVADIIPFERRGKALGSILASFSVASTLGIPLGLLIADLSSWRHTFHFIGAFSTVVWLLNWKLLPSLPTNFSTSFKFKQQLKLIKSTFQNKNNFAPYSIMMMYTFSGFMLFPFLSPYAVKNIGLLETDLKYIYLVGGIFTILFSRWSGRLTDQYGTWNIYLPSMLLSLPFIWLYTSVENLPLIQLLVISTGFMVMINFRFVPLMTLITKVPTEHERGGFMGVLMALRSFAAAGATAFTGFLITETSTGKLIHFNIAGYISIAISLLAIIFVIKLDKQLKNPELMC